MWGAFPVVPVIVKGYWYVIGGRWSKERGTRMLISWATRNSSKWQGLMMPKGKWHNTFEKHWVGKLNSWPFIHYFWTPPLEHFASTRIKYPLCPRPRYLSLPLCPWVLLQGLNASCCWRFPHGQFRLRSTPKPSRWLIVFASSFSFIPTSTWLNSLKRQCLWEMFLSSPNRRPPKAIPACPLPSILHTIGQQLFYGTFSTSFDNPLWPVSPISSHCNSLSHPQRSSYLSPSSSFILCCLLV